MIQRGCNISSVSGQEKGKGYLPCLRCTRLGALLIESERYAHTPNRQLTLESRYIPRVRKQTHTAHTHTPMQGKEREIPSGRTDLRREERGATFITRPTGARRSNASASTLTLHWCTDA